MPDSKTNKGFTLIEVLIAMAIIAVGLISLVSLFPVGLRSSRLAGDFTTASFIAQQALDSIRAAAQVYDPADLVDEDGDGDYFDDTNGNGLGYYDLPVSAVKFGQLVPQDPPIAIYFPYPPQQSQWWKIRMLTDHDPSGTWGTFEVTSSVHGVQANTGTIKVFYQSDSNHIQFILSDNKDGPQIGGYAGPPTDRDYDEFVIGDELLINIEMHAGNAYYWYAMRAPMTEDVNLDGILGGRLPDGTPRVAPYDQVDEDTGLDLIPDYWDRNNNGTYEAGLDQIGETGFTGTNDPHGDNQNIPKWTDTNEINPNGKEGNGQIDAVDDNDIQKVTVIIGWREGGRDRVATFSAAIPNQFR